MKDKGSLFPSLQVPKLSSFQAPRLQVHGSSIFFEERARDGGPSFARTPASPSLLNSLGPAPVGVSESLKNSSGRGEELQKSLEREICRTFSEPLTSALRQEMDCQLLELLTEVPFDTGSLENSEKSYLVVTPTIVKEVNRNNEIQSKRFQIKKRNPGPQNTEIVTNITVAKHFPCAISRQPTLVTTEFTASGSFF